MILNLQTLKNNCTKMLEKAATNKCLLRPHVKTHKTIQGALLQTGGVKYRITCSTLAECEFFKKAGFDDILYAVPIDPTKLIRANEISKNLKDFKILVDNIHQVRKLQEFRPAIPWNVTLMVDCGYGR